MNVGPERLTPESRQALADEALRRGLVVPSGWPPVAAPPVGAYVPPGTMRYVKASLGARFLALIIDWVAGIVPAAVIFGFIFVSRIFHRGPGLVVLGLIAACIWPLWYSFIKDGREGGQSIGKDMMDLMVVNVDTNRPCTMSESAIRALVWYAVNLVPVIGFFVEPIMAIADENGRRLGDLAAHTQVIPVSSYIPTVR